MKVEKCSEFDFQLANYTQRNNIYLFNSVPFAVKISVNNIKKGGTRHVKKKVKIFTNERMEDGKVDIYGFMTGIKKPNMDMCMQEHTKKQSKNSSRKSPMYLRFWISLISITLIMEWFLMLGYNLLA